MFLWLAFTGMLACVAALISQRVIDGHLDRLDIWALPALCLNLLVLLTLLRLNLIRLKTAFEATFYGTAIYVLLALHHQFQVMPASSGTLMENTYWFAVLYAGAFLTFPTRKAIQVSGVILLLSAVICAWNLHLTAPEPMRGKLIGSSVQFLLTGVVMTLMQATFGVQRAQLLASRSAAYKDGLTGLANRRAAEERLSALTGSRQPYTLVLFDLDHFKQVNDQYGHATGDLVLRGVAAVARAHLPPGSVAARWGGEEFLLILPPLADSEVRKTLNTLRNDLRQQQHGAVVGVTASFGVATAQPGENVDAVLARADAAMYTAKQQGRNDIRMAEGGAEGGMVQASPAT